MTDIEDRLRAAMHAAVDAEEPPGDLISRVMRRHRRRSVLLAGGAVLAALAVAVSAAIALPGGVRGPGPATSTHHSTPPPKQLPATMTGLPRPAGNNFQFLLGTSQGAAWYSTATRRTQPIAGLPASEPGYGFRRVQGGWSASSVRIHSFCATYLCAGPPYQFYFVADGSLTATRIGAGIADQGVQPSNRTGAVWLVSYPRSTDNMATTSASVQLVSTTGQALGPRYRLPPGYWLDRGVGSYLVIFKLQNVNPSKPPATATGPSISELWDPRTRQVVRRFDRVIAVGPEQIAWSPACAGCQVQVLNVSTGKSMMTAIPGQPSGTFSDDGRLLAVQQPSGALGVFDTQTQALTMIPGIALSNAEAQIFWWQDGGHRLVVLAGPGNCCSDTTQVGYWQPGDTRLRVATMQIPGGINAVMEGS